MDINMLTAVGILVLQLAVGGLLIWYGQAAMNDRIAPNYYLGLRTKKTLSDPEKWYKGNRYAGKVSRVAGAIVAAAALIGLVLVLLGTDAMITMLAVVFINAVVMLGMALIVLVYDRYRL